MYVILVSKPGVFRTELGADDGFVPVETYDYIFYGKPKARFVIAEITRDTRVQILDEAPPPVLSRIPSKFLEKYQDVEEARKELESLVTFGHLDVALRRVA